MVAERESRKDCSREKDANSTLINDYEYRQ